MTGNCLASPRNCDSHPFVRAGHRAEACGPRRREYSDKRCRPGISINRERQLVMLSRLPCKLVVEFGVNIFGIFMNNIPRLSPGWGRHSACLNQRGFSGTPQWPDRFRGRTTSARNSDDLCRTASLSITLSKNHPRKSELPDPD